jgi:hypothetical protein
MKILKWDIETSPIICTTWGLYDQNINHDNILEDWKIICAAWQWEGEKKVHSAQWNKTTNKEISPILGFSDENVIIELHKIISQADVLVAQNGDSFDMKKFNARAIYYGLPPLPDKASVDTLKVARKVFKFSSNRLDYLGKYLGIGGKLDTPKGLWNDVIKGVPGSLENMVKYCKVDVIRLGEIYEKLRPYIKNHPNRNLFNEGPCCSNCGSKNLKKQGFKINRTGKRQQYQCIDCAAWSTGELINSVGIK